MIDFKHLYFTNEPFRCERCRTHQKQLAQIKAVDENPDNQGDVRLTQTAYNAWLDIDAKTAQKYLDELATKRDAAETTIGQFESPTHEQKSYVENAPARVVTQTKQSFAEAEALLANINPSTNALRRATNPPVRAFCEVGRRILWDGSRRTRRTCQRYMLNIDI